jgi:S1-C subfamily serine protease
MISPQKMLDAVVSIGEKISTPKKTSWIGTGFIVSKRKEDDRKNFSYYLITNKHVVKDLSSIIIRFNIASEEINDDYEIILEDKNRIKLYSEHWDNNADVIAHEINPYTLFNEKTIWQAFNLDDQALTLEQMNNQGLQEGSLIYVLGFPMGLVNFIKTPIFRLGCISRIRDAYILRDFNPTYYIDAQSFPGNSGGPIISRQDITLINNETTFINSYLIGIVSGHYPYRDKLYSGQTGEMRMVLEENSGIAVVHPVDRIKEVVELEFHRVHG